MNQPTNQPRTPEDLARWGVRCIDDFTTEELALLQQKLEGWTRNRTPSSASKRRRQPFVMKRRISNLA